MQKRLVMLILVLTFVAVAIVIWKGFTRGPHGEVAKQAPGQSPSDEDAGMLGRPLRVGIVSWPGYAGGLVANRGFKPNKTALYWTKYHLLVEFVLMEDADVRAKSFARGGPGDVDVVWTTVDFWANELPGFVSGKVPAKAIMQVDWSRGGDAIVASKDIQRVEDLAGKRIALALLTPSHWFLENVLAGSKLKDTDVTALMKTVIAKNASPDARQDFVAGKVDAAVVWQPDVTEALRKRPDAHILASSKEFDHLLADCMVARENFIADHPDAIKAFINGWFDGTAIATRDHPLVVRLLMENEPLYRDLGEERTRADLETVKWADLSDNVEMFGLDGRVPLFNTLFSNASALWQHRGFIHSKVAPADAADIRFLREIYNAEH